MVKPSMVGVQIIILRVYAWTTSVEHWNLMCRLIEITFGILWNGIYMCMYQRKWSRQSVTQKQKLGDPSHVDDQSAMSLLRGKTRWSPRTRMPTRMLRNRDQTYFSHLPANPLVRHPALTHWGDTLVGHPCLTLLRNALVRHSCFTLIFDTLVWHSCLTLLLDTLTWHSYLTLLTWHSYLTLWLDTSSATLLLDTLVNLS